MFGENSEPELQRFEILQKLSTKLRKPSFEPVTLLKGTSGNAGNLNSPWPPRSVFFQAIEDNCNPNLGLPRTAIPKKKIPDNPTPLNNLANRNTSMCVSTSPINANGQIKYFMKENMIPKTAKSGIISRKGVIKKSLNFSLSTSKKELKTLTAGNKASGFMPLKEHQSTLISLSEESLIHSLTPVRSHGVQMSPPMNKKRNQELTLENISKMQQNASLSFKNLNESIIEGNTAAFCLNLKALNSKQQNVQSKDLLFQSEVFTTNTIEGPGVRVSKTLTIKQLYSTWF